MKTFLFALTCIITPFGSKTTDAMNANHESIHLIQHSILLYQQTQTYDQQILTFFLQALQNNDSIITQHILNIHAHIYNFFMFYHFTILDQINPQLPLELFCCAIEKNKQEDARQLALFYHKLVYEPLINNLIQLNIDGPRSRLLIDIAFHHALAHNFDENVYSLIECYPHILYEPFIHTINNSPTHIPVRLIHLCAILLHAIKQNEFEDVKLILSCYPKLIKQIRLKAAHYACSKGHKKIELLLAHPEIWFTKQHSKYFYDQEKPKATTPPCNQQKERPLTPGERTFIQSFLK